MKKELKAVEKFNQAEEKIAAEKATHLNKIHAEYQSIRSYQDELGKKQSELDSALLDGDSARIFDCETAIDGLQSLLAQSQRRYELLQRIEVDSSGAQALIELGAKIIGAENAVIEDKLTELCQLKSEYEARVAAYRAYVADVQNVYRKATGLMLKIGQRDFSCFEQVRGYAPEGLLPRLPEYLPPTSPPPVPTAMPDFERSYGSLDGQDMPQTEYIEGLSGGVVTTIDGSKEPRPLF